MSNTTGIIIDTQTSLKCTLYSTSLPSCYWGSSNPVEFETLAQAEAAAADMNGQAGAQDRFIGSNPKPR